MHQINLTFDCAPSVEVKGVFLGISKAFENASHLGLICKLEPYGVKGKLLDFLTNYLYEPAQKVALNGQCCNWERILSGVPHEPVLGVLLFLIYTNDLPQQLNSIKIFADDTSLSFPAHNKNSSWNELNNNFQKINDLGFQRKK